MRLSKKVYKQHSVIAIIQAIILFLLVFMSALFMQRSTSEAAALRISRVRIRNNPLYTSRRAIYSLKYRLNATSIVYVKVSKGGKYYRTFKVRRRRGYNYVKWNGRDNYGHVVPRGTYKIKIYAKRSRALSKPIYSRIYVRNDLLFSDYFDRPDGLIAEELYTSVVSDPLGKWKVTAGSLYAKNYQGYTSNPVFRVVTQKADFTNFKMSADMMADVITNGDPTFPAQYDGLKLFFRYQDAANLYVAAVQNSGTVVLSKKVNDVYTTLGNVWVADFQTKKWYNLTVIAKSQSLQVWLDGTKYIDVFDSSWSKGRVGIRTDNVNAYFDNFSVYTQ